ncbi:uncharacterized protein B0I36DRAFT_316434 [Microdochium trichocladiopsis]|uniref:Uncharacterized protein n=1 Tax=Microdochium trichocladiopsis TaxID=1682393 RepID=A0A9P8YCH1_9PEZI|nr:uncharacterized protein B0I36DRAFT_316434 [Microdochium trichocladiopsis]KAH7034503.1 hypothetical protein B0I36DRAFT_316434 [Microdochium trichocladiopsis]
MALNQSMIGTSFPSRMWAPHLPASTRKQKRSRYRQVLVTCYPNTPLNQHHSMETGETSTERSPPSNPWLPRLGASPVSSAISPSKTHGHNAATSPTSTSPAEGGSAQFLDAVAQSSHPGRSSGCSRGRTTVSGMYEVNTRHTWDILFYTRSDSTISQTSCTVKLDSMPRTAERNPPGRKSATGMSCRYFTVNIVGISPGVSTRLVGQPMTKRSRTDDGGRRGQASRPVKEASKAEGGQQQAEWRVGAVEADVDGFMEAESLRRQTRPYLFGVAKVSLSGLDANWGRATSGSGTGRKTPGM